MKKGDYLISKIHYEGRFLLNKSYKILDITISDIGYIVSMESEWSQHLTELGSYNILKPAIYDYFYTPQETRKIKLDKINKND